MAAAERLHGSTVACNHESMGAMSDLYDTDVLLWSERQAGLLRRRAAGELVNEAELDWPNIAEEIESVGSEQRHAVESLLVQALLHRLKAAAWPLALAVPHWDAEARVLLDDARRRFAPSMRQRLDLAGLYRQALRGLPVTLDGQPPLPVPDVCPVTLDELLADD
jgi:hypothetical protein